MTVSEQYSDDFETTDFLMAGSVTCGVASLLEAQDQALDFTGMIARLIGGAEDQVGHPDEDLPGWDRFYGHGRVNTFRSLTEPPGLAGNEAVLSALSFTRATGELKFSNPLRVSFR